MIYVAEMVQSAVLGKLEICMVVLTRADGIIWRCRVHQGCNLANDAEDDSIDIDIVAQWRNNTVFVLLEAYRIASPKSVVRLVTEGQLFLP